jgi:hypothetical protein
MSSYVRVRAWLRRARQLLEALLSATPDQTCMLTLALAAVLDSPAGRAYVRPRVDIESILAPVTDVVNATGAEPNLYLHARYTDTPHHGHHCASGTQQQRLA